MDEFYQNTVSSYDAAFHMDIKKGPDSMNFTMETPEGPCSCSIFDVLPFVHLMYYEIHAHSLPGGQGGPQAMGSPVQLNYCLDGKTELMLDDNTYIYMGSNDLCISCQSSQGDTYFPLKFYRGIAIYFEDAFFSIANRAFTDLLLPDVELLKKNYLSAGSTFLGEANPRVKATMERLWKRYGDPEIFYKRLHVLELLHCLIEEKGCQEKTYVSYTNIQVEIAKQAEKILTKDLSRHIPVKTIAQQFGVSETSLKNYFRGVYGKNISLYLHDLRMTAAEQTLVATDLPISEIAAQVGYTKQGKFAQVFKDAFGQPPLEYRRMKKLEAIK